MVKWEYTSTALITEQKKTGMAGYKEVLNKYGQERWELVCVTPINMASRFDFLAYFKRQIECAREDW